MASDTEQPRRRSYKRATAYPVHIGFNTSTEMEVALDAEAKASGQSLAAVVRDAVSRGLPLVRDARRKQARQERRQSGRQGPGK